MDEQERKMLQETVELSRNNNVMLRKLLRAQRAARLGKLIYWAIIIGALVVGYNWIKPLITPLITFFNSQDFAKVMNAVHSLPK